MKRLLSFFRLESQRQLTSVWRLMASIWILGLLALASTSASAWCAINTIDGLNVNVRVLAPVAEPQAVSLSVQGVRCDESGKLDDISLLEIVVRLNPGQADCPLGNQTCVRICANDPRGLVTLNRARTRILIADKDDPREQYKARSVVADYMILLDDGKREFVRYACRAPR